MSVSVLLARQRSGTGALGSVLDQHSAISYLGEVFHDDSMDRPPNYFWFLQNLIKQKPNLIFPNAYSKRFDAYVSYLKSESKKPHVVIDIKYRSTHQFNAHWLGIGDTPSLFHLLKDRKISVVHLMRRNHLKTYISGRLAEANKVWHATDLTKIATVQLEVDIKNCLNMIQSHAREDELVQRALRGHPKVLQVDYAELFGADGCLEQEPADKLAEFFQVEAFSKKRPAFVKQTSDGLKEIVKNYDQLAAAFVVTPFAWMLHAN